MITVIRLSFITILAAILSACSYGSHKQFEKIPATAFLPHKLNYVGEPFDGEWRDTNHKAIKGKIYVSIAPVTVQSPLCYKNPVLVNEAKHIAKRFERQLKKEFVQLKKSNIYIVKQAPAGHTLLTIQCAIIDLQATNTKANVVGTAAGVYVPGASVATNLFDKGHITFAAKIYAGNKLVTQFAECDNKPTSLIVSLDNFTPYGNQRAIVDEWAHAIAMDIKGYASGKRVHGAHRVRVISGYTPAED